MGAETDFQEEFYAAVDQFASNLSPPIPVKYPGVQFNPGEATIYIAVSSVANRPQEYGIANDGPTLLQGFFQLMVCGVPNVGKLALSEIADDCIARFPKGTEFGAVRIYRRPYQSGFMESSDLLEQAVTFPYRGFV